MFPGSDIGLNDVSRSMQQVAMDQMARKGGALASEPRHLHLEAKGWCSWDTMV